MKRLVVMITLVCAAFLVPAGAFAKTVSKVHQAHHPSSTCPPVALFVDSVNLYHETMYAGIYEEQSGSPCAQNGNIYAQAQVDFSGNQKHVGTIYAELLEGPPYLPIESNTITYSPSSYVVRTPNAGYTNSCLKAFVLFDGNGIGYMSKDTVIAC